MAATTGYQAGVETSAVQLSYGIESVWGTKPATAFQAIRLMKETLGDQKTRQRPQEINQTREASAAITTQEAASGTIDYALSFGTFDDLFAACLGADWQAPQTIAGIAGDITITTGTNVLSSTLTTKFSNINAGQWVRLLGFTNAANNGIFRVVTKTDNSHLVLTPPIVAGVAGAFVTEIPAGTAAQVRASTIQNGLVFKSVYLQKMLSSVLYLQYPGLFVSGMTLTGSLGQFIGGTFTTMAQQEISATTNGSTGAVLAAPGGRVHDSVNGFGGVLLNEVPIPATVDSFSINVQNTGAAAEYGMGSSVAAGMLQGVIEVSGQMKMYFKDFTLYSRFKAETQGNLEFVTKDVAGNAYVVTLPNAVLMNPQIQAGGPGQAVYATFQIEGTPGGMIQLDRLPAT